MDFQRQKSQSGFTLIELLITVVVLGVLVALAAPSFFKILETRKIIGATDLLHNDLVFAKTESIKRNQQINVVFKNKGTTNWCYGLTEANTCDCKTTNSCNIDGVERVTDVSDFPNVSATWNFTGDTTGFDDIRGVPTNAGTTTFSVDSSNANVVLAPIGRVRICSDTGVGGYPSC